ncbi:MAG: hypothetical protein C7B45_16640 [Sulfobacillus acidophilus]|uniref:DUF1003 domain-containing protein n=1 Tax=Sulfobacillus acidophilus TaxID=53633 RepID=A0A2T2WCY3_9FIRM|nr:MAG: hypothetical protein C7B45_16640 [Sulfobacillus acidophilus]
MRHTLNRINEWVAVHVTLLFGTMWTTYAFFLYGLLPLLFPGAEVTLLYWSNTVQLWSLPLLMVGTNVLSRASERQARRQYEMVTQITQLTEELHTMMAAQRDMLTALIHLNEAVQSTLQTVAAKTAEIDAEVDALTDREGIGHGT